MKEVELLANLIEIPPAAETDRWGAVDKELLKKRALTLKEAVESKYNCRIVSRIQGTPSFNGLTVYFYLGKGTRLYRAKINEIPTENGEYYVLWNEQDNCEWATSKTQDPRVKSSPILD